jgi:hypothetical protein
MRGEGGHRPSFRLLLEGLWYESSESPEIDPLSPVLVAGKERLIA